MAALSPAPAPGVRAPDSPAPAARGVRGTVPPRPRRRPPTGGPGDRDALPHVPALDGVRALAVTAVLLYHLGASWTPGGFLGVDVFFVLSGFLITSLLLAERARTGGVDLGRFYLRRARRLLPALYVVLVATTAYVAVVLPEELARLRGSVAAAVAYVTNWWLVGQQQSYFEALGRPDLLRHLWSLAVEEQFYLLWPLVLGLLLTAGVAAGAARGAAHRGRGPALGRALAWTLAGVAVSTLLMAVRFDPFADPSRVYYGTDTRAAPLLLGAALAMVWRPWRVRRPAAPAAGRVVDGLGLVGLLGLLLLVLTARDTSPLMYRGGFLLAAVLAGLLVAAVVHPSARLLPAALGVGLLQWVGLRSYALYLWHWPVFMVTRPRVDVPLDGLPLALLRLALTAGLAWASFRFVEDPVRRGAVGRWVEQLRGMAPARRTAAARHVVLATGTSALVLTALVAALVTAQPPAGAATAVARDQGPAQRIAVPPSPAAKPTPPTTAAGAPARPVGRPFAAPVRVSLFGDSQGMTLALNVPAGLGRYVTLRDATVEGCGVLLGRMTSAAGVRRDLGADCASWPGKWRARVAAQRPQVALVNLGAWDVFDLTVGGRQLRFGTPAWDAYYSAQLEQGLGILLAGGAQVALAQVPCYRPVAAGGLPRLPERGDDARTRHLNGLLAAAAARHPGRVFVVSPPAAYCTNRAVATSLGERWDGVHYYKPGAKRYFDAVVPQLLRIPQPRRS